ncbi:MAG: nitroreductase [Steroidobacterales bacterium]
MNSLECLLSRRSVPVPFLRAPGPSQPEIDMALDAALRAPDHNQLRPWRFKLIRGAARAHLSELFVRQMRTRVPPPPAGKIDKARTMPLTAPLVIAVGAHLQAAKVPEIEQLLSAGAAVMNLLNAFYSQGYGAIWLTGDNAYDPAIARVLGFGADERCLGFLYVGSLADGAPAAVRRPERDSFVSEWTG